MQFLGVSGNIVEFKIHRPETIPKVPVTQGIRAEATANRLCDLTQIRRAFIFKKRIPLSLGLVDKPLRSLVSVGDDWNFYSLKIIRK